MATTEGDPVYTIEAMLGVGHLPDLHSRIRAKAEQDKESRHSEPVGVSHAEG